MRVSTCRSVRAGAARGASFGARVLGVRYRTTAGGTRSLTRIPCGVLQLVVDKREDAFDVCRAAKESISELW